MAQQLTLKSDFEEQVLPRAKVTTDVVMGVMMTADDAEGDPAVWSVIPPQATDWGEGLCLRVTSRDGTYESTNEYAVPDDVAPPVAPVEYPTAQRRKLRGSVAVVRATLGSCLGRSTVFVPVYWKTAPTDEAQNLRVFLNTGGQNAQVATASDYRAVCQDVPEGQGIKYTAICEIPGDALVLSDTGTAELYFKISRNREVERVQIEVVAAQ